MEAGMSITLMTWHGFGPNACYGSTCMLGQFCSENSLYEGCRNCSVVSEWCDVNRTHLASKYPSCFYICAENALKETNRTLQVCLNKESDPLVPDAGHYVLLAAVLILMAMLLLLVAFPWEMLKQRGKDILHTMGRNVGSEAPRNVQPADGGAVEMVGLLGEGDTTHVDMAAIQRNTPPPAVSGNVAVTADGGPALDVQRNTPPPAVSGNVAVTADGAPALDVHGSARPDSDNAPNGLRAPCPVQDGSALCTEVAYY